jgi:hypothetical protein
LTENKRNVCRKKKSLLWNELKKGSKNKKEFMRNVRLKNKLLLIQLDLKGRGSKMRKLFRCNRRKKELQKKKLKQS